MTCAACAAEMRRRAFLQENGWRCGVCHADHEPPGRRVDAELSRLKDALRHAVHRNHTMSDGCSACTDILALLQEAP